MTYTVRFCHLAHRPDHKIGDVLQLGDVVGKMGNTGQSFGAHLHIDCVEGEANWLYKLHNMETGNPKPAPKQLNYFIDNELFDTTIKITTYYCDPEYFTRYEKMHFGYDVIPKNRNEDFFEIMWNRSMPGTVISTGYAAESYGHYIYIKFET